MKSKKYPILEFDADSPAVVNPLQAQRTTKDMPVHCVLCFFNNVIEKFVKEYKPRVLYTGKSEIGRHPAYELRIRNKTVALMHPGVGAPLAAGLLEEMIGQGGRKFVVCGGAGVLDGGIPTGHLIIPASAVRDEGTSYHYLPPGREVNASPSAVSAIKKVFTRRKIKYLVGKTWTTDAFYRETKNKVALRKAEGCLTVEMEAAALFAVAKFRKVKLAQILYAGDDVSGEKWDSRQWDKRHDVREKLLWLAAEACLEMK